MEGAERLACVAEEQKRRSGNRRNRSDSAPTTGGIERVKQKRTKGMSLREKGTGVKEARGNAITPSTKTMVMNCHDDFGGSHDYVLSTGEENTAKA